MHSQRAPCCTLLPLSKEEEINTACRSTKNVHSSCLPYDVFFSFCNGDALSMFFLQGKVNEDNIMVNASPLINMIMCIPLKLYKKVCLEQWEPGKRPGRPLLSSFLSFSFLSWLLFQFKLFLFHILENIFTLNILFVITIVIHFR